MEVSQKPFARKVPDQLVYLELGSGNGGMLLSVSEEGFRFRAVTPLRPNGLVPFAFSFDGILRLNGVGEVEWLDDDAKSGGMRFADVSDEFRAALNQWLAAPSRHARSGREIAPDASTPLDSIEKIREDLRRGRAFSSLPPQPAPPPPPDSPPEPVGEDLAPEAQNFSARDTWSQETEPPAAEPEPQAKPELRLESVQPRATPAPEIPPLEAPPEAAETPRASSPASALPNTRPPVSAPPRTPLRPHFSQPADDAPVAPLPPQTRSPRVPSEAPMLLPLPIPAEMIPPAEPDPPAPAARAPLVPEVASPRPQFRAASQTFTASARPHIPPIDESFEVAWQHARLLPPPEAPHLSRATASAIIGLALLVILGAFAINFRQDVGQLVITLGQKISGASAPAPTGGQERSEAPPAAGASNAEPSKNAESKPESAAPPQKAPVQAAAAANSRGTSQPDSNAKPLAPASNLKRAAAPNTTSATRDSGTSAETASPATSEPRSAEVEQRPAADEESQLTPEAGGGQEEFVEARELLRGVHRKQDLSRAVDLLWAGVRKGYVPAEVTLADLYRRGDGVEKNCDQAQVLLVAASKKGSPDARRMLELMAEQGCE